MTPTSPRDPAGLNEPLTEAEFDELGQILASGWAPETTLDPEQLDGLLAGLICGPRVVMPSELLPAIFGEADVEWPDMETAQRFLGLLMRRWNEIATAFDAPIERLDDPRAYVPYLIDWDENAELARQLLEQDILPRVPLDGELWARGFLRAVELTRDDWSEVPEDEDDEGAEIVEDALGDILALIPEAAEAESVSGETATDAVPRDELVDNAIVAAYDLREYWRAVDFERARVKEPIRRAPKVGRNDPCPCGSGRKFKFCHGRGE